MKDSLGTIIYIGKSKNLKSRVASYFVNSKAHSTKVQKLVKNLKDFDYTLTDTEFEALLLECKMIKEIKPIYNRMMKNPKGYCYIKIDMSKRYPDIEICNEVENLDKNLYFGPYTSKNTIEKGLNAIKDHLKILCTNTSNNASGCLKYQKNLCIGMCTTNLSKDYYFSLVEKIIKLLSGKDNIIIEEMEAEMNNAAINLNFELAAKYRDYIKLAKGFISTANIINFAEENKNIALVECLNEEEIKLFLIRYNKVIFSEIINKITISEMKAKFLKNVLFDLSSALKSEVNIGKNQIDEANIIYNYLKSNENRCKYVVIPDSLISVEDSVNFINDLIRSNIK